MNVSKAVLPAVALSLFALAFQAPAQTAAGGAAAVRSDEQIDDQYKLDKKRCDAMKGNEKDICQEQAEATRDKAKADAKAGKEKAEASHDAARTRNEADYKVGKEKCDALSGNAKDACIADLKTRYGK
jgi:septal ring factor EnvC (AmiA/AmiB activator)